MAEISDRSLNQIRRFLAAWPKAAIKAGLKEYALGERDLRFSQGWQIWQGEGDPPMPYEWQRIGQLTYYREPSQEYGRQSKASTTTTTTTSQGARSVKAEKLQCPICGAEAFAQAVCPACAKGKAGIRKMYLCGENSNHVFYTE